MEPILMNCRSRMQYSFQRIHKITLAGIGFALITSCSSLNPGHAPDAGASQQSPLEYDGESLAAEFNFPQASCGEQATEPSGTWYVVYLDEANPDEVRRKYCRDAIGTVRDETGVPSVQVASFTDYDKALKLAAAVDGEVETTVMERPSPTPGQAEANSLVGRAAFLTAKDSGSLINIRRSANTAAPIEHTGRAGDEVRIADQMQGDDGQTWYKVAFTSGQEGWVRGDFVSQPDQASSQGANGDLSFSSSSYSTPDSRSNSSHSTAADSQSSQSSRDPDTSSYANPDATIDRSASSSVNQNTSSATDRYQTNDPEAASYEEAYEEEVIPEEDTIGSHEATLVADDPNSRINIRDSASTSADVRYTGSAGEPVYIISETQGEDGYTWYEVEFESGAIGWVRGDLID